MAQSEKIDWQVEQLRGLCDSIKPCLDSIPNSNKKSEVKDQVENAIQDLEKILKTMEYPQPRIVNPNPVVRLETSEIMYKALDLNPIPQLIVAKDIVQYANKKAIQYFELGDIQKVKGLRFSSLIDYKGDKTNGSENNYKVENLKLNNGRIQKVTLTLTPLDEFDTILATFNESQKTNGASSSSNLFEREKLEHLLKESPTVIYSAAHTYPHAVSYMSPNIKSISGHAANDFVEHPSYWADHIHPDDANMVFKNFNRVFSKGQNMLEYRFLFADNTYHWMQDCFRLSHNSEGEIIGIIGSWVDITRKKESQLRLQRLQKETAAMNEELRASQEELMQNLDKTLELNKKLEESERFARQVIASANEGIYVLDKELRYTAWNPYMERLLGFPAEKVIGKRPIDVSLKLYLANPERTAFLERALGGETVRYGDLYTALDCDHGRWSTGSISPLKGNNDEIVGVIGTVIDITERKAIEIALNEQKNLLQSFYDTASFPMGVFELIEDDFIYTLPNKVLADILDQDQKSLRGKKASELNLPASFIRDWVTSFEKCIDLGATIQKETSFIKSSGQTLHYVVTFSPIDDKTISLFAQDITDRKKAEEERNKLLIETQAINRELILNQKNFKLAQALARLGIWEFNVKTRTTKWSDVMFELYGLNPNEPIPDIELLKEMVAPESREKWLNSSRKAIKLRKELKIELKLNPKDVPYRWISSVSRPILNEVGEVEKIIGIFFDITEQKKANEKIKKLLEESQEINARLVASEEELKQSLENSITLNQKIHDTEQRWLFALEGSGNGVWDYIPKTNAVFYSNKMKEMMNCGENEEMNTLSHWEAKVHPEDIGYVMASVNNCLTGVTELYETEYRLRGKENSYFWVLARGKVVEWSEDGEPLRMIGTITDITERKQYEVNLANAANYLNKLINTIIDPIFVKDRNHRLILVNDACCELAGLKREFLLGKTDFDLLPKEKAEVLWEIDEHVLKSGEDHIREEILVVPNGSSYNILTKKSLYVDSGGDCLLVGLLIDITHQKNMERQLKEQNENLKKINDELDSFVYRTSHDLRSPLASVLGLINISRDEKEEKNRQMYMDLMEKSILRLDRFIHDIINFSKNTRIDVIEEEINLREMIDDILEGLKYMDGYERIEKRTKISQKVPFVSDLFRLKIICNNLISNAIKYSSISANAPFISIKIIVDEKEGIFDFVDNGVGIAKENVSKVFDMFFRGSTASKGSGLGLYIVKEIVQKLKGDISIQSELGEGTTFRVVLPNKL